MDYSQISKEIRKKVLKMLYESQTAHLGSSLSCADILTVLYFGVLKIDPKNPLDEGRDRFILSKGHAAAGLYATLAEKGFFGAEILDSYCKDGGKLAGHSTRQCVPGIEVSTGALGHGLPMACGVALAGKKDKKDYRVFVLMSDGECQEGATWEAALFANQHKLDNLIVIIDYNKLQAFGRIGEILEIEPFVQKWQSFGWFTKEIKGHDFSEIEKSLIEIPAEKGKPTVIIANTIKGKGISFMEDKLEWHYYNLTDELYKKALDELKQ